MSYRSVTHIALRVASIAEAEDFYCALFAMEVIVREEISMLSRDIFTLALEHGEAGNVTLSQPLAHIGLHVDEEELERLQNAATKLRCKVARVRPDLLIVGDRYGVQWEVTSIWPPLAMADKLRPGS